MLDPTRAPGFRSLSHGAFERLALLRRTADRVPNRGIVRVRRCRPAAPRSRGPGSARVSRSHIELSAPRSGRETRRAVRAGAAPVACRRLGRWSASSTGHPLAVFGARGSPRRLFAHAATYVFRACAGLPAGAAGSPYAIVWLRGPALPLSPNEAAARDSSSDNAHRRPQAAERRDCRVARDRRRWRDRVFALLPAESGGQDRRLYFHPTPPSKTSIPSCGPPTEGGDARVYLASFNERTASRASSRLPLWSTWTGTRDRRAGEAAGSSLTGVLAGSTVPVFRAVARCILEVADTAAHAAGQLMESDCHRISTYRPVITFRNTKEPILALPPAAACSTRRGRSCRIITPALLMPAALAAWPSRSDLCAAPRRNTAATSSAPLLVVEVYPRDRPPGRTDLGTAAGSVHSLGRRAPCNQHFAEGEFPSPLAVVWTASGACRRPLATQGRALTCCLTAAPADQAMVVAIGSSIARSRPLGRSRAAAAVRAARPCRRRASRCGDCASLASGGSDAARCAVSTAPTVQSCRYGAVSSTRAADVRSTRRARPRRPARFAEWTSPGGRSFQACDATRRRPRLERVAGSCGDTHRLLSPGPRADVRRLAPSGRVRFARRTRRDGTGT